MDNRQTVLYEKLVIMGINGILIETEFPNYHKDAPRV